MKPEAQRIAIIEHCHWQLVDAARAIIPGLYGARDPISDLDALHEAENALDDVQQVQYCIELRRTCFGNPNQVQLFYAYHATARQRARAFLGSGLL